MTRLFGTLSFVAILYPVEHLKINVNISEPSFPLPKFWKSTGFSPPISDTFGVKDYLLSNEVKVNLQLISSLPLQGIEFVRVHWLLSLLFLNKDGSINWNLLDRVLDNIVDNELKPIVELMGNTSFLIDRKPGRQFWYELCKNIAERYTGKYGVNELSQWKFELWNEPDLKMYNALNFSLQGYLEYVEGCALGLKSGLPTAVVGGPAGLFKRGDRHPLCWGFLGHCNASPVRCNVDYISFHKKGNGTSSEILNGSLQMRQILTKDYSNLSELPIVNDEADILSGWWKPEDWRGDARYAAAVVRTIFLFKSHLNASNVDRISIDNGFLNIPPNYFNQRTLLTRFLSPEGTNMFIQKPIYGAMGLMALLGEEEIPTKIKQYGSSSVFVTCKKNGSTSAILSLSVLVGLSSDNMSINLTSIKLKYKLLLSNSWNNARFVIYAINNELISPKRIWENLGSPDTFNKSLLKTFQENQEPHVIYRGEVKTNIFRKSMIVPQPSLVLLHICKSNVGVPGKIRKVRAFNMSYNEVLLTWKEDSKDIRCIKTFIVEHSKMNEETYKRVNSVDIIFNSFDYIYIKEDYSGHEETRGSYRVRAVDYWGREGEYSDTITYG